MFAPCARNARAESARSKRARLWRPSGEWVVQKGRGEKRGAVCRRAGRLHEGVDAGLIVTAHSPQLFHPLADNQ